MMLKALPFLMLVATATPARADDAEPPGVRLRKVAQWVIDVKADYGTSTAIKLEECTGSLAAMRAGKIASHPTETLKEFGAVYDEATYSYVLSLPRAQALCAEATKLATVVKDYALISRVARELWMLEDTSIGDGVGVNTARNADECSQAVTALTTAGIPASFPYVVHDRDLKVIAKTVGELEAGVCGAARKGATQYQDKLEAEEAARNAALTKAGITGDKMYWWKHYDGRVFTAGAREPDLAGYGKASVWFAYTYSSDPDLRGNHLFTVRRYQFRGSKLASSSEKTYRKPFGFKSSIGSVMK